MTREATAYTAVMEVQVRLFGPSADALGAAHVTVRVEGEVTCLTLRTALGRDVPALTPYLDAGRFAVNHAFARESQRIRPGDEVALIAMVSGG